MSLVEAVVTLLALWTVPALTTLALATVLRTVARVRSTPGADPADVPERAA